MSGKLRLLPILFFVLVFTAVFLPSLIHSETVLDTEGDVRIYSVFVTRGVETSTISWRTNPKTKGRVEYAGPDGAWKKTPWNESFTNDHSITLLQLVPDNTYLYRINAEDENKVLATKSDTFNTLGSEILGGESQLDNTSQQSSFQAILSPSPSPNNPSLFPPYYSPILGLQTVSVLPYFVNPNTAMVQPTPFPTPTPSPTLTPTPTPASAFLNNQSTNLILGVLLGIIIALLLHQAATRKSISTKFSQAKKEDPPMKKFQFKINAT